ncbi:hypothetical protein MWU63_04715 [Pseudohalocynthiibacter sp. F2068]|nr:hypothetical protein [Pseudohalocynthiibacter sp. F2068]
MIRMVFTGVSAFRSAADSCGVCEEVGTLAGVDGEYPVSGEFGGVFDCVSGG